MSECILIFAPHPDDEVLGCGGVSALKSQAGAKIHVYFLSDGSGLLARGKDAITENPTPKEVSDIRKEESRKGADLFGVGRDNHHYWDFSDGSLSENEDALLSKVIEVMQEHQPDEIYYMNEFEGHPDHVASNRVVRRACEQLDYAGKRYQYLVNLKWDYQWNPQDHHLHVVDISSVQQLKQQAIENNQSHLSKLSPLQTQAPWPEIPKKFLSAEEVFIIDE